MDSLEEGDLQVNNYLFNYFLRQNKKIDFLDDGWSGWANDKHRNIKGESRYIYNLI